MDDSTHLQLTRFPCLRAFPGGNLDQEGRPQNVGFDVPQEVLLLSWAILLKRYTGQDNLAFIVDDDVIIFDSHDWRPRRLKNASTKTLDVFECTGVFHHEALCNSQLALQLHWDAETNTGRLLAGSLIPQNHVPELSLQLEKICLEIGDSQEGQLIARPFPKPRLSILNPDPELLEGPSDLVRLLQDRSNPQNCALDFLARTGERKRFSYAELELLSGKLARRLGRKVVPGGAGHGRAIVPILLPQSPELYIAILAVLKSGAAFCPLGLDAPEERVKVVFKDTSPQHCITNSVLKHRLSWCSDVAVVLADEVWSEDEASLASDTQPAQVDAEDIAYLYYTSGSTGLPKGVAVTHRAVTQSLLAHDALVPAFSRFLQFAAPTFDVFIFEMLFPLFRGATLVGCHRTTLLNNLGHVMKELEVDSAELTPTVATSLLRTRETVPSLKLLLTIGEMLTRHVIDEFGGSDSRTSILCGMYGPTESAIHCTAQPEFPAGARVGIIGRPLAPVSAFVLAPEPSEPIPGSDVEILPLGQVGELALGGYQLAAEYLNRPEQTRKAFIHSDTYGRMYRTGDKARFLLDGTIECLGRIASGQVKLRGQRIELGEIEHTISKVLWCRTAIATVIDGTLVAICLVDSETHSAQEVLDVCKRWLPTVMIPADIVLLTEFPRLPSGKVDRKALEAKYRNESKSTLINPTGADAVEERICSVVQEVLGHAVDSSTKLARSGLDSLKAIKLASLLRESGYYFDVVDILAADNVRKLLDQLDQSKDDFQTGADERAATFRNLCEQCMNAVLKESTLNVLLPDLREAIPCTPLQSAMLAETSRDSRAYCNWIEIEFPEKLSFAIVKGYFQELSAKNDILRSGFWLSDTHVQMVWKNLADEQFVEVNDFTREYQLKGRDAFLRPMKIQICTVQDKTRAVLHMPHFMYDGWSMELILSDLSNLYEGRDCESRPQFRTVSQHFALINSASREQSTEFWRDQLHGYSPLSLPNYNGCVVQNDHHRRAYRQLSMSLDKAGSVAQSCGLSTQTLFQGALACLLSAYLGVADVAFGVVTSGRTIPVAHVDRIIGPCIATLPLRVNLAHLRTTRDLLQFIHESNRALLGQGSASLQDIKKAAGLAPGTLIFDTLFVWQETLSSSGLRECAVKEVDTADYLEFPLVLEFQPAAGHVDIKATYRTSLLPEAQVHLLLSQLDQLINFMVSSLDAPLSELNRSLDEEHLSVINQSEERSSCRESLDFSVQRLARTCPDAPAIAFYSKISEGTARHQLTTYKELNAQANQLARLIAERKQPHDELVCICMPKSPELYVAILATIRAGLGYLPINPETPEGRKNLILDDSRVRLCICSPTSSTSFKKRDVIDLIEMCTANLHGYSSEDLDMPCEGSRLAYAVYTSGSSGKPKGVLVTRDNLSSNLEVLAAIYPLRSNGRLLQACSQSFDVSVFEIFFAWYTGMCLCSAQNDTLFRNLEMAVNAMEITHLSLTPTVAALIDPRMVPKVEFLVTAGEPMTLNVLKSWAGRGLFQGYGPSETTNICTVREGVSANDLSNNIGAPFKNTSALIFKESSTDPVPRGALGELCFGGTQVARGYMNLPELTAQKFIDHPKYGRLYRSGDIGRLLPDNSILFAGRLDDQVKVRGHRIELGEVNTCVLQSDEVSECYTTLVQGADSQHDRLVTFWVPKTESSSHLSVVPVNPWVMEHIQNIFLKLGTLLPSYMMPNLLVPVTSLPTTTQSKVDKRALITLFGSLQRTHITDMSQNLESKDSSTQWSDLELSIARTLSKAMNTDAQDIGRHTSFFSLGVDSITGIKLAQALEIELSTVLRHPTVAGLARVSGQNGQSHAAIVHDVQSLFDPKWINEVRTRFAETGRTVTKILPCTPLQEAMLATAHSPTVSGSYYNRMQLRISGDGNRLKSCWQAICRRHEILRTCFLTTQSTRHAFAQVVIEEVVPRWSFVDTTVSEMELAVAAATLSSTPNVVDSNEIPFSFVQMSCSGATFLLFFCHHALYDDIAMHQLLHEVEQMYWEQNLLPSVSYEGFLGHITAVDVEEQSRFWAERFDTFEPVLLPKLLDGPCTESAQLQQTISISESVDMSLKSVETACHEISVTLLALGQAAWSKLLSSYLGETDVCFGNVVSGRNLPLDGLDRLVAPCFNTLPVRVDLGNHTKNIDLMRALRDINGQNLRYQSTPLRRIPYRRGARNVRLFDTVFLLQQPARPLDSRIWVLEDEVGTMDIPLVCEMRPEAAEDRLLVTLNFDSSIIGEQNARCIVRAFCATIVSCLRYPSAQTSDHGGLPPALLSMRNAPSAATDDELSWDPQILEVIQDIVPRTSLLANIAILSEDDSHVPILGIGELSAVGVDDTNNRSASENAAAASKNNGQTTSKSGVVARMLASGKVEFLHRIAQEVKLRGRRIYLDEISSTLKMAHPSITAVYTQVLRHSKSPQERLVAFISATSSDADALCIETAARKHAAEQLQSYQAPERYFVLDERALPSHAVIDKSFCNAIYQNSEDDSNSPHEKRPMNHQLTWAQAMIRSALSTISGIESQRIGATTSIYQLGIDSISAVQVAALLSKQALAVSAADILEHPTIGELASFVDERKGSVDDTGRSFDFQSFDHQHRESILGNHRISGDAVEAMLPCTPLQNGLVAQFANSRGLRYFTHQVFAIPTELELSDLRQAWQTAMECHPLLRAGFSMVNESQFATVVYEPSKCTLPFELIDAEQHCHFAQEVRRKAAAEVLESMHLPTWRVYVQITKGKVEMHLLAMHALYDARSLRLILADVASACETSPVLRRPPIEPVLGSILVASQDEEKESERYWMHRLESISVTRFPTLTPLRVDMGDNCTFSKSCSKSLIELQEACKTAKVTMQAAGEIAWARLLSEYVGESNVTFGVVLSGRSSHGAEDVVFPCITTVPFPCDASLPTELQLETAMKFNASVQRHQFVPLSQMQRWAGHPNRPLFDTVFAYQKTASNTNSKLPWELTQEFAETEYSVSMELEPRANGSLNICVTFRTDVLPEAQAKMLVDQYDKLLMNTLFGHDRKQNALIAAESALYSHVPPKQDWITSEVDLLHQLVERSADKLPDRVALQFVDTLDHGRVVSRSWTYKEMDMEGNRIANLVRKLNVQQGSLVGICFEKCPQASFAILGILKAGCAFVALDPAAPPARKAYIMEDSGATLLLYAGQAIRDLDLKSEATLVSLDHIPLDLSPNPPLLQRDINPQDLSYCLYTSGSTGLAKGCEITHENAVQAMLAFSRMFGGRWNEESRWLQFASFHFDVCVLEQFWSWSVGIRVVSAPRDVMFEDLAGFIRNHKVTHLDLTPSLARLLDPKDVPSLWEGVFITGGEQLSQEVLDSWGPIGVIHNGYGPTEATIGVTMFPRVPANGKPSNIGYAFDNVGAYVLRPGSEEAVLRGGVGELCLYGKLVGKGYRNRRELTSERFPFSQKHNVRLYRTGDLVRLLHDGSFDFLGRADDQVKLRGQRIEIGEINHVIKKDVKAVADVVTVKTTHPRNTRDILVSFIVTKDSTRRGQSPGLLVNRETVDIVNEADEACRARLPGYMVPTYIVPLTCLPLSPNNKSDIKALKALFGTLPIEEIQNMSKSESLAHSNLSSDEQRVIDILSQFIQDGEATMLPTSNIFQLGMDSISVIAFARRLKTSGFDNATVSLVMQNPTPKRLAKLLTNRITLLPEPGPVLAARQAIAACQHAYGPFISRNIRCEQNEIESVSPCTPLQQGMISRSLSADKPLYFGAFHFELSDAVDISQLYEAWQRVFEKVQILRTQFVSTQDGHLQVALQSPLFPWVEASMSDETPIHELFSSILYQWWSRNRDHLLRPFELVLHRSRDRRILTIHIAHPLYDGNSLPLLLEKVTAEYRQDPRIDYGPAFQDTLAYGPLITLPGAESFWAAHLAGASSCCMPGLVSEPDPKDSSVTVEFTVSASFEDVRRTLGVTHQAMVQACWAVTLQRYLGSRVTLGLVVAGRAFDYDNVERTIGPLFNTLPFSIEMTGHGTWEKLIQACHEINTSMIEFQHTPLRDISKWVKASPSRPLFDTLFVYQKEQERSLGSEGLLWQQLDSDIQADYPLAIEILQKPNGSLSVTLTAQGHIANEEHLHNILSHLQLALQSLLTDENARIPDAFQPAYSTYQHSQHLQGVNEHARPRVNGAHHFAWTPEAQILREEIAALSGLSSNQVDESSSVFELGLDSIDAIKLSSRLKTRGISIPVSTIMKQQSISGMLQRNPNQLPTARAMNGTTDFEQLAAKLKGHLKLSGLQLDDVEKVLPVTPLQEAMVTEMVSSDFSRYYNHDVLQIKPGVETRRLRDAWRKVFEASSILRTTFMEVAVPSLDASFVQIVHRTPKMNWTEVDVSGPLKIASILEDIKEKARSAQLQDHLFDLTLVSNEGERYLVLTLAHALYDGWSLSLLHSDVERAYERELVERPPYESVLRDVLDACNGDAQAFWQNYLSTATFASFPMNSLQVEPVVRVNRIEAVSKTSVGDVKSQCRRLAITPQAVAATCFATVLSWYRRQLDVVFGTVFSGRDSEEASNVLFPTMNTVAVRSIIHGTRKEMLRYMQDNMSSIRSFQHFPLRKVQALARRQGKGLFDTLFIYQRQPERSSDARILCESTESVSEVEYPLCVELEETETSLVWRIASQDSVFSPEGVKMLLQSLETVFAKLVEDSDSRLLEFNEKDIVICGLDAFQAADDISSSESDTESVQTSNGDHEDWSPTETKIRNTLASVSQMSEDSISKDMSLFHMGLDSISAIKVAALLRQQSLHLSVSDILRGATVRKMAELLMDRGAPSSFEEVDASKVIATSLGKFDMADMLQGTRLREDQVEEMMPCTPGQVYMLTMWQLHEGRQFFYTFQYQLQGDLSAEQIREAWDGLVRHSPILRTIFVATGAQELPFVQMILKDTEKSIQCCEDDSASQSDQTHGQPLVDVSAHSRSGVWLLSLKIHHALYDGVSLPKLIDQLEKLLNGISIPAAPTSAFRQLVAYSVTEGASQKRKAFWTEYLRGVSCPSPQLPSIVASDQGRTEMFRQNVLDMNEVGLCCRKKGLSVHSLLLAAFARTYVRLFVRSTDDPAQPTAFVFGVYLANRSHPIEQLSEVTAPTVNLVPIRVLEPLTSTLEHTAARIQEDLLNISNVDNSTVGLWEIEVWTGIKLDTFVNLLQLPDTVKDGRPSSANGEDVGRSVTIHKLEEPMEKAEQSPSIGFSEPPELQNNAVRNSYRESIDVEAAVRDGGLDIGVFGAGSMLDVVVADGLVEKWKKALLEFVSSDEPERT